MNPRALSLFIACMGFLPALLGQNPTPSHHIEGGFRNTDPNFKEADFLDFAPWVFGKLGDFLTRTHHADIPRTYNDGSIFRKNRPYTVTWIGHATALIQIEGKTILTDPVWNTRVGPASWAGAPRISEPGISLEKLPPIDIVLISHNHYDHLDEATIAHLAKNRATRFFVPLRVRDWFEDRGITNVVELDWWEGITYQDLKIICTPTQHFSGRWFSDRNETLWASWVVLGKHRRMYFGGDSGYFTGFAEIGRRLGPFDLALLPIGAYEPQRLMHPVHMNPGEAVQAFLDLKGRHLIGIHWGTFVLSDEPMDEPPGKVLEEARKKNLSMDNFWMMILGETREW